MSSVEHNAIRIKGARQHNLKNLDVAIPRHKLVVITGLSGSGKSSLAFDTLFAEGQRKYVESLSAYARQFLDQMQKPDVDYIEGLSPAIAIEQRTAGSSPRSTIATTTEIYDYLRLLYAAAGTPHDPANGKPVARQTPQEIADTILTWPQGTRFVLLAPLVTAQQGEFRDVIDKARREGFVRLRIDGETIEIGKPDAVRLEKSRRHTIEAVVDRLVVRDGLSQRLADSVETALRWGNGKICVSRQATEGGDWVDQKFSTDYCNPETGFTMPRLTPKHFSFNSHVGACTLCHGIGTELFFDPDLMIDQERTLAQGAIRPWRSGNSRMRSYYAALLQALLDDSGVSPDVPFKNLPPPVRSLFTEGSGDRAIAMALSAGKKTSKPFEGLVAQMERLHETSQSEFTKKRLRAYQNRRTCRACNGERLRPELLAVTLSTQDGAAYGIQGLCALSIKEASQVVGNLALSPEQEMITTDVLREIRQRLGFLNSVGLGYLQLNRESGTLSGGEAQRIRLATQIGSGLSGVMYVLDEPSIGLHQRDNDRLIGTLRNLRDLGNSVIVVEHDEDTIRAADHILDLGPGAGPRGGQLVAQGTLDDVLKSAESLTAQYLNGSIRIPVPKLRTQPRKTGARTGEPGDGWLRVIGASENNLANITAAFPVGCLTCVTGVSGSGKSTLVNDILRNALERDLNRAKAKPGRHRAISGIEQFDKVVVIDQSPVGRTPRSNPATYTGALGPIRDLFSELPAARVRGYDASRFSFNAKGGRCEHCQGDGFIRIEMHFLADVYVECEICRGKRYNRETLEITYKGKNIADVLDMTVDDAARFFRNIPALNAKLERLQDVGLGYLRLGQSATTLSGGEAQRIKLAAELAKRATGRTVYILDEPTTGLHFADIHKLLEVLMKLRDARNTLIVIEHNLEVIKCADWVVDLGPEGGSAGGKVIAEGTPEQVARVPASHTGKYLSRFFATVLMSCLVLSRVCSAGTPIEDARTALRDGIPQAALAALDRLPPPTAKSPLPPEVRELRLEALFKAGRWDELLRSMPSAKGAKPIETFWQAQALAALGNTQDALNAYASVADASPGTSLGREATLGKARMLADLGRRPEAMSLLSSAMSWPDDQLRSTALLDLAELKLQSRSDVPEAAAILASLPPQLPHPLSARKDFLEAKRLTAVGDDAAAVGILSTLVPPDDATAVASVIEHAAALERLGRRPDAESLLESFIESHQSIVGLDLVFRALDDSYKTSTTTSVELKRWAEDSTARERRALAVFYSAVAEIRQGRPASAVTLLRQFLEENPAHALASRAALELAVALLDEGRPAEALAALTADSPDPRTEFVRGLAYAALCQPVKASASFRKASTDESLAESALYNAAVQELQLPKDQRLSATELRTRYPSGEKAPALDLIEAFAAARQGDPTSAQVLETLAGSSAAPKSGLAEIAIAEQDFLAGNSDEAARRLRHASADVPPDRAAALGVFLADQGTGLDEEAGISAANEFLKDHPGSAQEPDVRMKLAELLYRKGDFGGARMQFETLARKYAGTPYEEPALFFAAQSASKLLDVRSASDAMALYEEVVALKGPFASKARFEQAVLQNSAGKRLEAISILDQLATAQADPDLRSAAVIEKGKTLFLLGQTDPAAVRKSIQTWQTIVDDPQSSRLRKSEALYRIGYAHESLGENDAAIASFYSVVRPDGGADDDSYWFYKAGFDAGRLLEAQKRWEEAVKIYSILAAKTGSRSNDAKARINKIRLENFLWEDG